MLSHDAFTHCRPTADQVTSILPNLSLGLDSRAMSTAAATLTGTTSGSNLEPKGFGKYDDHGRRRMGNSRHSKQMMDAGIALWDACNC